MGIFNKKGSYYISDKYLRFNYFEIILLGISAIADVVAIFSITKSDWAYTGIAIGTLVMIGAIFTKYMKVVSIKAQLLNIISKSMHKIDHELRDIFFQMFEKYHKKEINKIVIDSYVNSCGKVIAEEISKVINHILGSEIRTVVKIFEFDKECIKHSGDRKKIDCLNTDCINIRTIGKAVNGSEIEYSYDSTSLSKNNLYSEALKTLVIEDSFVCSDTFKFVENYEKIYKKQFIYPRINWNVDDKGIIIISISDEKHKWKDVQNSESTIIGLIKIVTNTTVTFNQKELIEPIIDLIKAASDSLYKCIERQKYYYTTC